MEYLTNKVVVSGVQEAPCLADVPSGSLLKLVPTGCVYMKTDVRRHCGHYGIVALKSGKVYYHSGTKIVVRFPAGSRIELVVGPSCAYRG